MPIQIRVMSWNIQKKQTNAAYIARLMQTYTVDICVLLEVPNSAVPAIPTAIIAELNNLTTPYFNGTWQTHSVDVGDEAVTYIWHQATTAGTHNFMADLYPTTNNRVAGRVLRDGAGNMLYFPTTGVNWTSLPTTSSGRRPAFMSFVTNDGTAARRFTVLDYHAPFNKATYIQAYGAAVYGQSREILTVDGTDAVGLATAAAAALPAAMAGVVDPLLAGLNGLVPLKFRTAAVQGALKAIQTAVNDEAANMTELFRRARIAGVDGALWAAGIDRDTSAGEGRSLAMACAMAGALAATSLLCAIHLPSAPPGAVANIPGAQGAARTGVASQTNAYAHPTKRSDSVIRAAIQTEAQRIAAAGLATFTFAALARNAVDSCIVAGDFNVDYPDGVTYSTAQQNLLGGNGNNAYTRLAGATTGGARNTAKSTRVGPTAFEGQRVYKLKTPCPIQHTNASGADYVPLDVSSLVTTPTSFIGNAAWSDALLNLARAQGVTLVSLQNPPYSQRLFDAFDIKVLNDTAYYRANCYDNIFVRGGTFVGAGTIDAISELGSWTLPALAEVNPQPGLAPNPWAAALGHLNAQARTELSRTGAQLQFQYNTSVSTITYNITPALADAEDAAVFLDQYLSDHLPVRVELRI